MIALLKKPRKSSAQRLDAEDLNFLPTCTYDIEATSLPADMGFMLCCGIKPWGKPTKLFRIDCTKGYQDARWDDSTLVKQVREELEKYRICIAWNGDDYDVRYINTRLVLNGLKPMSSDIMFVDPIWVARKRLRLHSNSLASVIEAFKLKTKKSPVNGHIWVKAMTGDKEALEYIVEHNLKDCEALEEVVRKISSLMPFKYGYIR